MCFIIGCILILLDLCPRILTRNSQEQLLYISQKFPDRMLILMDNYVARSQARIEEVLHFRGKYDVSPHYEYGYVMSEILDRYRKMVGHVQRPIIFKSDAVFDTMKRTEMVQKLFMDIFHLVYMFHEIPPKYSHMPEFISEKQEFNISFAIIEQNKRHREWVKKKYQREIKKEREMIKKGEMVKKTQRTRRPNKWWPIDYGWEIDYQWW